MADEANFQTSAATGKETDATQRIRSALVFISHDTRDAQIAEAFSRLLGSVSAGVLKSFRSSDKKGSQGIEYGVEWYPEIMKKLESASDVVCLITQNSVNRPWILYEAGVAKGKLDTPVHGLALGIELQSASTGPFAQFQNSDDSDESMTSLVVQLVKRIPNAEPDRDVVRAQVQSFKQKITSFLKSDDMRVKEPPKADESSIAKLFEEIKIMYQDLPARIERRVDPEYRIFSKKRRRFHPPMLEEMLSFFEIKRGDPLGLLIMASAIRDDVPWIYELVLDYDRACAEKSPKRAFDAHNRLLRGLEILRSGRLVEPSRDKELNMLVVDFSHYMEFYLSEIPAFIANKTDG